MAGVKTYGTAPCETVPSWAALPQGEDQPIGLEANRDYTSALEDISCIQKRYEYLTRALQFVERFHESMEDRIQKHPEDVYLANIYYEMVRLISRYLEYNVSHEAEPNMENEIIEGELLNSQLVTLSQYNMVTYLNSDNKFKRRQRFEMRMKRHGYKAICFIITVFGSIISLLIFLTVKMANQ